MILAKLFIVLNFLHNLVISTNLFNRRGQGKHRPMIDQFKLFLLSSIHTNIVFQPPLHSIPRIISGRTTSSIYVRMTINIHTTYLSFSTHLMLRQGRKTVSAWICRESKVRQFHHWTAKPDVVVSCFIYRWNLGHYKIIGFLLITTVHLDQRCTNRGRRAGLLFCGSQAKPNICNC